MSGGNGRTPTVMLVAEARHLSDRALREAQAVLRAAGWRVKLIVPEDDRLYDVPANRPEWDAVVSRGRDLAGLGILAAASALGVPAINRPQSIDLVRNKIAMQAVLLEQGLPLPRTWFASDADVFRVISPACFPLVVKPYDGDGSIGLALLTEPDDVDLLPEPAGRRSLFLAQEFLETDGWDLKLYGIGNDVWAVRKPSPVRFVGPGPALVGRTDGAEPVPLGADLRDIGLTCGRACGLDLWGVDVAMTPDGPRVIEVNDFPTYSAVPEAGEAIARHIQAVVRMEQLMRRAGRDELRSLVRS